VRLQSGQGFPDDRDRAASTTCLGSRTSPRRRTRITLACRHRVRSSEGSRTVVDRPGVDPSLGGNAETWRSTSSSDRVASSRLAVGLVERVADQGLAANLQVGEFFRRVAGRNSPSTRFDRLQRGRASIESNAVTVPCGEVAPDSSKTSTSASAKCSRSGARPGESP